MANINIFGTIHNVTGEPAVEAYQSYDNVEATSKLGELLELSGDESVDQHTINETLAEKGGSGGTIDPMTAKVAESIDVEGYKQLLYIESTGTQYIDIGVIPNINTGFEVDFLCNDALTATEAPQIFNAGGKGTNPHYAVSVYKKNTSVLGALTIGDSGDISAHITSGVRQYMKYTSNGSTTAILADGSTTSVTVTAVNVSNSIYLFAMHDGNNVSRLCRARLYGFKLYNNLTLTHNFVPVQRLSDNEIGLYDTIGQTFYGNSGSGTFEYSDNTTISRFSDLIIDASLNPDKYKSRIEALEAAVHDATITDDLNVTETVGGVSSGNFYEDGTSIEHIIREMLNPTVHPTYIAPTATLTADTNTLLECNSTTEVEFTLALNKGEIQLGGVKQNDRSGNALKCQFNSEAEQNTYTHSFYVDESHNTYTGTIWYDAGPQPKNSLNEDEGTPLAAGSVNSNTITFTFRDAIWANTANKDTVAKLNLVSGNTAELNFPATTEDNPEEFHVPAYWTITSILFWDGFNKDWADCSREFTQTSATHPTGNGGDIPYAKYKCNLPYNIGARSIKITWTI